MAALAIAAASVFVLGSFDLFAKKAHAIVYINESLNGLNEGAPVKYRGVTIGSVKRVMVKFNQADDDYSMPVILEFQEDLLMRRLGEPIEVFTEQSFAHRIQQGLRASLQTESIVTGVLYIELQLSPNAPPPVFHQLEKKYVEIPTEPTEIQKIFKNLASFDLKTLEEKVNRLLDKLDSSVANVDFKGLSGSATSILSRIDELITSPDLEKDLKSFRAAVDEIRDLAQRLRERVDPVADELLLTLKDGRRVMDTAEGAVLDARRTVDSTAQHFKATLDEVDRTLAQVIGAVKNIRAALAPDAGLRHDLDMALRQVAEASQAISDFVEILKLHPNAILVGREYSSKR